MVSIICTVKNRTNPLKISLTSWLMCKKINEIIIVDWSSDEEINYLLKIDDRIKIVRVDNKKNFNVAASCNLAVDFVTNEYFIKMDADYVLNPYYNFIDDYKLEDKSFLCGNYRLDDSPFYKYLNGFIYLKKEDFLRVKGFNENIENYGYDDDDLYYRLQLNNLFRHDIPVNPKVVFHIPHSDAERVANYETKNHLESLKINRSVAKFEEYNERKYSWDIEKIEEKYFKAIDKKND